MKRNLFVGADIKTLLQLNIASIIITAFCEIFVIYTFISKGLQDGIVKWKFFLILMGLIIVSLLFLASIVSFIYFLNKRGNQKMNK